MKITVPNFKKFNPRNDLKSMPWLRLQNNFYDLEDFYNADVNTTWLFIFFLCQCAQKVSDTIDADKDYLIFKSKLTKNQFNTALEQLLSKEMILLETNESERIRSDQFEYVPNERTNITNARTCTNERDSVFDFNLIYEEYPKKSGKALGLKKLSSIKMTQDLFDKILHGAKSYKDYISSSGIEERFVKQFSTWVNQECWNDEYKTKEQLLRDFDADLIAKLDGGYFNVGE